MNVVTVVEYHHFFDGPRPDPKELLKDISSKYIIAVLAMINDVLSIRGNSLETQAFLIYNIADDFPVAMRDHVIVRAGRKLKDGFEIFNFPYTVEMINRELIHFKTEGLSEPERASEHILAIFKAYLAIVEELTERDVAVMANAIEEAKQDGNNVIRLMWPHLMRQYQFANRPDPLYEINRGQALFSFLEGHSRFGSYTREYFRSLGCNNYHDYSQALLSLFLPHLQRNPSPKLIDYFYKITTDNSEPLLETMVVNHLEIAADQKKQFDYLGLKERPIFRFGENQYVVPYWDFFINAIFTGFMFSFYNKSGIRKEYEDPNNLRDESGFGQFKGTIGTEFSEGILFRNTIVKCFNRKYESLIFFDNNDYFNPDCYYRQGCNIFIMEFKDYTLGSNIIQSGSYETIKEELDKKFVSEVITKSGKTKIKEKGISQLARHIEKLESDESLFWKIDAQAKLQKLKLRNMNIYPIIIQTSIYFDFPGVNDYLDKIIQDRLNPIRAKFKRIIALTMIEFRYFQERLLLFADSKLELADELEHYHKELLKRRKRANRTQDISDNFAAMDPFGHIHSPAFKRWCGYRRADLREAIESCWKFRLVDNPICKDDAV